MPTTGPRPITTHKQAFLQSQIRLLSAPLHLPSSISTDTPTLPSNVQEEILTKVNKRIATSTRTTFPPNTLRHVAEQIDSLYWRDVLALSGVGPGKAGAGVTIVGRGTDLSSSEDVSKLPETLSEAVLVGRDDEEGEDAEAGEEESRYAEIRAQLVEQTRRREELEEKLAGYTQLQELLRPFEGAKENVQPNLVTRDGELSRELDRMRMLIARVGAKVKEGKGEGLVKEGVAVRTEEDKLGHVLGLG